MRVLLFPLYFEKNVNNNSASQLFWKIGVGLRNNGVQVAMVHPDVKNSKVKFEFNIEHYNKLTGGGTRDYFVPTINYHVENAVVTEGVADVANIVMNEYPVDYVLLYQSCRNLSLRRVMEVKCPLKAFQAKVPVVNFEDDTAVLSKEYVHSEIESLNTMVGCLSAPTIYVTPNDIDFVRKTATSWFSFARIKKALDSWQRVGSVVDVAMFDAIAKRKKKWAPGDCVKVLYSGALTASKHPEKVAEMVGKAYELGANVKLIFQTWYPYADVPDLYKNKPYIDLRADGGWKYHLAALEEADMYVCTSDKEGGGFGMLEYIVSGLVPLFRERKWWRYVLETEVPLVADGWGNLFDTFYWAVTNFEKAKEIHEKSGLLEYAKKEYSINSFGKKIKEALLNIKIEPVKNKMVLGMVEDNKDKWPSEFSLDEGCKLLTSASEKGLPFGKGGITKQFVRQIFLCSGYRDVGDVDNIVFKKEG